jgi:branched-chain amino acid aminotransferase
MQLLGFKIPPLLSPQKLTQDIRLLCEKNNCTALARIRLAACRGNGGISDGSDQLHYTIEAWPLGQSINRLNENGFIVDIYPDARKSCDRLSNLKSANYLPYVMAARYAKQQQYNDALVLNMHDRVADASIANIFLVKDHTLYTPSLEEGCVNGVMRRWLVETFGAVETTVSVADILAADELFLTNAIYGIRWIKQFRTKTYTGSEPGKIHRQLVKEVWGL